MTIKVEKNIFSTLALSSHLICFIRTRWLWFDQIWLRVSKQPDSTRSSDSDDPTLTCPLQAVMVSHRATLMVPIDWQPPLQSWNVQLVRYYPLHNVHFYSTNLICKNYSHSILTTLLLCVSLFNRNAGLHVFHMQA